VKQRSAFRMGWNLHFCQNIVMKPNLALSAGSQSLRLKNPFGG
jgi:hypothetical protein